MDYLEAWKITNRLFYPVGMYNFGDQIKTVIIIWSLDKLITLAFRGIEDAIKQNKPPYNVYEIITNGELLDVISTKTNTLCLSDQECTYFTSYKTVAKVTSMKHIIKIKSYSKGFVCIKNNASKVSIQLYNDNLIQVKSYNLDWDANPTQSKRNSEIYALNIIDVNKNNKFLKTFLKVEDEDLHNVNEIILFSINSTLYWLQTDNESNEYNVVTLYSQVTNILSIFYLKNQEIIVLFLQCGLLEIFHETGQKIKISQIFFENEIIYSNFLEQIHCNIFIYTNKFGLFQSNIIYDSKLDEYKAQTKMQPIFGVTCFTFINDLKLIICATENNCYYSTKLLFADEINNIDIMEENNNKFISIDNEFLKQNRNFEECLINEIKTFNEIKADEKRIQDNWKKLGVISNERFINNFNENYCIITANEFMPLLSAQSFIPNFKYKPKTIFLKFQLFIKKNLLPIIEFDKMWKTCITLIDIYGTNISYILEIAEYDFSLPVDFLIPYQYSNKYFSLPKIEVFLTATVDVNNESILIKIPVHLRNEDCYYLPLIEIVDKPLQCFTNGKFSLIDNMLLRLNQNNIKTNKDICSAHRAITFNLIIPKNFDKKHLLKIFPNANNFEMNKELFITLNKSNIKLIIDSKTNMLTLTSDDPGALCYIKQYMIGNILKIFKHYELPGQILGKFQIILTSLNDNSDLQNVKYQTLLDLLNEVRQLCAQIFFLEK